MWVKLLKRAGFSAAAVFALSWGAAYAGVPGMGTWESTLLARDLNGDGTADAFYDADLGITWLRNADANGRMNWDSAVKWADGLTIGGWTGWRLPTSNTCRRWDCIGSEMGHLFYVTLGNSGYLMTNTGDFINMQPWDYWSGTEYGPDPSGAWKFSFSNGHQGWNYKISSVEFAMAVHPGDIGVPIAVPEPEAYALLLAGLAGLSLRRRSTMPIEP